MAKKSAAAAAPADGNDPAAAVERLAGCDAPLLIGVRHHAPSCAAAIPALLDAFQPERLFLELPVEMQPWIEWLGHPGLVAPVALAGVGERGGDLAFYPYAEFSPELAAVRWAVKRGVAVEAFDLPIAERAEELLPLEATDATPDPTLPDLMERFCAAADATDSESLWDQLVEARAPGTSPEGVRRAGLLVGWAMRVDATRKGAVRRSDLRREAFMRSRLAAAGVGLEGKKGPRTAAIVGAFHAAALLPEPLLFTAPGPAAAPPPRKIVTSLIAYSFELFDSRSGYPAGIRDPLWQQQVFEALSSQTPIREPLSRSIVEICRAVRDRGHVAGIPDANEAVRLAMDLAELRGLPSPGRRELLEAVQSALGRGELLGMGRVLAKAMDKVLVGRRRGQLASGTPRSGLAPFVEQLLRELKLPLGASESKEPEELRLDPIRSDLDRRRHVTLERLSACGVAYAQRINVGTIGEGESLTTAWSIHWTPATEAMIELAGVRGVTLAQAAAGALRAEQARLAAEGQLDANSRLEGLRVAGECGLGGLVEERLTELMGPFLVSAQLPELLAAAALVERIERGHLPGLPAPGAVVNREAPGAVEPFTVPPGVRRAELIAAAVRAVDGLAGSTRPEDAVGLAELVQLFAHDPEGLGVGEGRLGHALDQLAQKGSPLMQGAGSAARLLLGRMSAAEFSLDAGSWVDSAVDATSRSALAARLMGALLVSAPRLEADLGAVEGILERVEALDDRAFLVRLPAMREGFDVLSPASRQRLLDALAERYPGSAAKDPRSSGLDATFDESPAELGRFADADREGRAALEALGLARLVAPAERKGAVAAGFAKPAEAAPTAKRHEGLSPPDRWRLILGRERQKLSSGGRGAARALDELYGRGRGEGSREGIGGQGGGQETGFPTVREWAEELDALFGDRVREEVLGKAAIRGRPQAALALEPEQVTPSIELLQQVLSLKGGLAEANLGRLRRLVKRIVDDLVKELATRVRPALTGLSTPRPTRRKGGRLDLARTIQANLHTARREEGRNKITPERLIFRTRARRSIDWRIVLVVDVSGSMEPSVIYSAVMAAILAGIPAVSVHFIAFNTEVIDLSHLVDDPLSLLLEVQVGGGTNIARGLRYARQLATVPNRTLCLTITDFEEGYDVGHLLEEVRALSESGVKTLGLAALDDTGKPRYSTSVANLVVQAGMPVAALTPLELARWIGEQIR